MLPFPGNVINVLCGTGYITELDLVLVSDAIQVSQSEDPLFEIALRMTEEDITSISPFRSEYPMYTNKCLSLLTRILQAFPSGALQTRPVYEEIFEKATRRFFCACDMRLMFSPATRAIYTSERGCIALLNKLASMLSEEDSPGVVSILQRYPPMVAVGIVYFGGVGAIAKSIVHRPDARSFYRIAASMGMVFPRLHTRSIVLSVAYEATEKRCKTSASLQAECIHRVMLADDVGIYPDSIGEDMRLPFCPKGFSVTKKGLVRVGATMEGSLVIRDGDLYEIQEEDLVDEAMSDPLKYFIFNKWFVELPPESMVDGLGVFGEGLSRKKRFAIHVCHYFGITTAEERKEHMHSYTGETRLDECDRRAWIRAHLMKKTKLYSKVDLPFKLVPSATDRFSTSSRKRQRSSECV